MFQSLCRCLIVAEFETYLPIFRPTWLNEDAINWEVSRCIIVTGCSLTLMSHSIFNFTTVYRLRLYLLNDTNGLRARINHTLNGEKYRFQSVLSTYIRRPPVQVWLPF
uniref:Uncharacterized protein n=1 Tax=Onchocerca volvulus TaxID=6282 RepID=A0A8R1Y4M5_ONCVO